MPARSISLAFVVVLASALPQRAAAQSAIGYGEDATAAPVGSLRLRISNEWRRSSSSGSVTDSTYDTDLQVRLATLTLEAGLLKRFSIGLSAPWVTTKALTFASSRHAQGMILDTLYDRSHTGWGNLEAWGKLVWLGDPGQQARLHLDRGVHVRSAIVAGALLGTGTLDDPTDPFDVGTSDRARALAVHSATDLTIGRRFFGSFVARYEKPMSDRLTVAVRPADQPFTRNVVPFTASRSLGTRYELELTPRLQLGKFFGAGIQYRYHHGGQDSYEGTFTTTQNGNAVTFDASTLNAGTAITEHRAGFGAVYSAIEAYTEGRSRFPIEIIFEHSNVISVSGGRPKDSRTSIALRLFYRISGSEFRPRAAAPAAATP
ncbi:MAG: hypothetical protein M3O91_05920 [Chloroflexota bacterium]|nr:hypothetical protein [Chloroflexota bacterium]